MIPGMLWTPSVPHKQIGHAKSAISVSRAGQYINIFFGIVIYFSYHIKNML